MLTKFYYSTMKGAPNLASEWGSLLSLLKGCLLYGFNEQQVSSVAIAGGIATITLGSNHGFIEHQVVAISGANETAFNTEYRVISATNTAITIGVFGITAATGMMTIKAAPMGWTEKFTGTNKSVFAAKDTTKNRFVLRVDNSKPDGYDSAWAKFARVTIAESMSDIDTFAGAKAPTSTSNLNTNEYGDGVTGESGVYGWAKWYHGVNTTPYLREASNDGQQESLAWEVVGDDSNIYLFSQITNKSGRATYAFVTLMENNSTDSFGCFLSASNGLRSAAADGEYQYNGRNSANCKWHSLDESGKFLLRGYNSAKNTHAPCSLLSLNVGNSIQISGRSTDIPFPNKPDNAVVLHDVYVKELDVGIRGILPIVMWINNRWVFDTKVILQKSGSRYLILGADYADEGMTSFFAFKIRG